MFVKDDWNSFMGDKRVKRTEMMEDVYCVQVGVYACDRGMLDS